MTNKFDPVARMGELKVENANLKARIEKLEAENDRLWLERNEAVTKVQGWERVVFNKGFQPLQDPTQSVRQTEWGPGEGREIAIPAITPEKLTDLLDELDMRRFEMRHKAMKGTDDEAS